MNMEHGSPAQINVLKERQNRGDRMQWSMYMMYMFVSNIKCYFHKYTPHYGEYEFRTPRGDMVIL